MSDTPPIRHDDPRGARWGLAAAIGACTFVLSYAAQRLVAFRTGTPDWTGDVNVAHIPYYWRCALALLQAGIVASVVSLAVGDARAERVLRWSEGWVPVLVLMAAIAMVLVP